MRPIIVILQVFMIVFKELNKMSKKDIVKKYYFKGDLHFNKVSNKFIYKNLVKN
jgi:hypothetical protein